MTAGGHPVGVLGIPDAAGPFTPARQRVLAMAGALLAISIRNAQLFHELRENSLRDGLTGCFNRTHALDVIDTELRRARRSQTPVSLIMFDIDRFKDINDRYGHLCGDAVLAAVGVRMREVLRGSDLKCRYGGEEFLVLLPETPLEGAKRVADTLRRELAEMPVTWKGEMIAVTASFGVSVALPAEIDCKALIGRADAALYRAKDQGRNCVRLSMETAGVSDAGAKPTAKPRGLWRLDRRLPDLGHDLPRHPHRARDDSAAADGGDALDRRRRAADLRSSRCAARSCRRRANGRRWPSSASCCSASATAPSSGRSRPCRAG